MSAGVLEIGARVAAQGQEAETREGGGPERVVERLACSPTGPCSPARGRSRTCLPPASAPSVNAHQRPQMLRVGWGLVLCRRPEAEEGRRSCPPRTRLWGARACPVVVTRVSVIRPRS